MLDSFCESVTSSSSVDGIGGVPFACRDVLFHIDSTTIFVTKHVVICSFVAWYKNLIQHLPTVFLEQTEIKNSFSWFLHIIQYANKF